MKLKIAYNKIGKYFAILLCLMPQIFCSCFVIFVFLIGVAFSNISNFIIYSELSILMTLNILSLFCQGKLVNLYLNRSSDKQPFDLNEKWRNVIFYTFFFNLALYFLIAMSAFHMNSGISIIITFIVGILFYLAIRWKRNPNKQSIASKLSFYATFILPFMFLLLFYFIA